MKTALSKAGVLFVLLAILLAACATPTATPTTGLREVPDYSVELKAGRPASLASVYATYALGADSECDTNPLVFDLRPDDHNSFGTLPKMGTGDWDKLTNPTGSFPGFNLNHINSGCLQAQPGELYWDVYAVNFECGATNIHPITLDSDGQRMSDILLVLGYPGAPTLDAAFDPRYYCCGVYGFTSDNGDVAWAYGPESHIDDVGKGPYIVWANRDPEGWTDPVKYSDGLGDIGWWDDHCEPSPILKRTRKGGVIPPGDGYELIDVDEDGTEVGRIPFQTGTPPTGTRLLILRSPEGVDLGHVPWQQE